MSQNVGKPQTFGCRGGCCQSERTFDFCRSKHIPRKWAGCFETLSLLTNIHEVVHNVILEGLFFSEDEEEGELWSPMAGKENMTVWKADKVASHDGNPPASLAGD